MRCGEIEEAPESSNGLVLSHGYWAILLELAGHVLDAVAVPVATIVWKL